MSEEHKNHFIYSKVFPSANTILNRKRKSTEEIFKDALFVLDTNSLLVPYNTGKEDIEKIRTVYKELISKNKLFIPEHVLREFASNRSLKISELFTNIDKHLSTLPSIKAFEYPILGELDAYKKLNNTRNSILEQVKEYKESLKNLKIGITNWNWSDPVTSMYQDVFNEKIIINPSKTEKELIDVYNRRIKDGIPPGNKDASKEKNAIGDFVIWESILELGKEKQKDIVFISNDEKNDWLLKGNKQSISTRFELVDEYYRYTNGLNFISMNFSRFLELKGLEINVTEFTIHNTTSINSDIFNSLNEIENIISEFLLYQKGGLDEGIDFNEDIYLHIANFKKNNTYKYFDEREHEYFQTFDKLFTQIKSLNETIVYASYKMKRDTSEHFRKLVYLCRKFIHLYTKLKTET